jgi:hypothetical protein
MIELADIMCPSFSPHHGPRSFAIWRSCPNDHVPVARLQRLLEPELINDSLINASHAVPLLAILCRFLFPYQ